MNEWDILTTEDLYHPAIAKLARKHKLREHMGLYGKPEILVEWLKQTRSVMIRNQTKLTRAVLEATPNLLAIGRVGVGLDNIDVEAASEMGIVVIAPLEANAVSVAELTMGLIIALARKIPQGDRSTKAGQWDRRGCTGIELNGKTLTLCGYGRIGRLVAARARAFGMQVVVFDPFVKQELVESGVRIEAELHEALRAGDFVSAHLPLNAKTRGLIDARALDVMKPGAFVINTSRGGIVDENALLIALQRGQIEGAALDVRESEPPSGPNPFAALDNVILTPHVGAFTVEAQARTFEAVCADLDRVLRGEPAVNFVNFASPRR